MAREEARRTWRQLTADAAASHLAAWKRSGATLSEYARSVGLQTSCEPAEALCQPRRIVEIGAPRSPRSLLGDRGPLSRVGAHERRLANPREPQVPSEPPARSLGLSYQRLHRWRLRLEASGAAQQPAFLPVRILEAEPAAVHERASGLEVLAPGGLRIVVPPDFDASVLERLLRAVRRASC